MDSQRAGTVPRGGDNGNRNEHKGRGRKGHERPMTNQSFQKPRIFYTLTNSHELCHRYILQKKKKKGKANK